MPRVLVTGGAGFLGAALLDAAPAGWELHATRRRSAPAAGTAHAIDLAEADAVMRLLERVAPDLVIHTAYTMNAGERDIWSATRSIADACRATGASLVHMSSDLVLDGESAPYPEDALPAPVHEYGEWKARAEQYVRETLPEAAVVRSSLITTFLPLDPRGEWVAGALREGRPVHLFVDEIRAPIARDDLAAMLWEIATLPAARRPGVWHLAGPEAMSRYALGLLVAASQRLPADLVVPARSADAPSRRPRDLRLGTARADRELRTRPRALSELAAAARLATGEPTT